MTKRAFIMAVALGMSLFSMAGKTSARPDSAGAFAAPSEFEPQEFIWLTWIEKGSLGSAPFSEVALNVMRAITPHVKVRLMSLLSG